MGDYGIHHAHAVCLVRGVLAPEKENFSRKLLPDLSREVRRAVTAVETRDVCIGLLELRVLLARNREVAHHVQAVSASDRPTWHDTHDHLRHESNESLHLEDVQSTGPAGLHGVFRVAVGVLVAVLAANALVATAAERPAAVTW